MVAFGTEDIGNGALSLAIATFELSSASVFREAKYNLFIALLRCQRQKSREITDARTALLNNISKFSRDQNARPN